MVATGKHFEETYLRRFLDDPQKARGRTSSPEYGEMPNLELTKPETAALVAFINSDK